MLKIFLTHEVQNVHKSSFQKVEIKGTTLHLSFRYKNVFQPLASGRPPYSTYVGDQRMSSAT